jgi:hypothetical protein
VLTARFESTFKTHNGMYILKVIAPLFLQPVVIYLVYMIFCELAVPILIFKSLVSFIQTDLYIFSTLSLFRKSKRLVASLCCLCCHLATPQWLGKHIPVAMHTHITIEELLGAMFSV